MPELATVEHVSKNVWRVLGMNPGSHTLQGKKLFIESILNIHWIVSEVYEYHWFRVSYYDCTS